MSNNDYDNIVAKTTNSDKVRLLVRKIKDRGNAVVGAFLEVLLEDDMYKGLANEVRFCADELAQKQSHSECVVCLMVDTVDIKEIVDVLWQNHIISDEMHGKIAEAESVYQHRTDFWNEVVIASSHPIENNEKSVVDILCDVLDMNEDITKYLKKVNYGRGSFGCCCSRRRRLRPRQPDSIREDDADSEYSTTSRNLPSVELLDLFNEESQTELDLLEQTASLDSTSGIPDSFQNLQGFDSIGNRFSSKECFPNMNTRDEDNRFHSTSSEPFTYDDDFRTSETEYQVFDNNPSYLEAAVSRDSSSIAVSGSQEGGTTTVSTATEGAIDRKDKI